MSDQPDLKTPDTSLIDLDKILEAFWAERPLMREKYQAFIHQTSPLVKNSMLLAYMAGADDTMKFVSKGIKKGEFNA